MGTIRRHPPVKYVCAILSTDAALRSEVRSLLEERFGTLDYESPEIPFTHTNYYLDEMGEVVRTFVSFSPLSPPELLPERKRETNALEGRFPNARGGRRINLDVGYVAPAKLVLATTKDHGHRVYLGQGIFAELEYWYHGGEFHPLPWTFPDYRRDDHRAIFAQIRRRYLSQLEEMGIPARGYLTEEEGKPKA